RRVRAAAGGERVHFAGRRVDDERNTVDAGLLWRRQRGDQVVQDFLSATAQEQEVVVGDRIVRADRNERRRYGRDGRHTWWSRSGRRTGRGRTRRTGRWLTVSRAPIVDWLRSLLVRAARAAERCQERREGAPAEEAEA